MGKKSRLENRILNNRIKKFAQKPEKISSHTDSQSNRLFMRNQKSIIAQEMKRKNFSYNLRNSIASKKIEPQSSKCNKCGKITAQVFRHHIKSEDRVKQLCTECHKSILSVEKRLWENERKTISKMKEHKQKMLELKREKKQLERAKNQWTFVQNPKKHYPERHHGNDILYKPRRKDTPADGSPFDHQ